MAKPRGKQSTLLLSGALQLADVQVPYEVRAEFRRDTRFSLTTNKAYLRVPHRITQVSLQESVAEFKSWLTGAIARRPVLADAHRPAAFLDGAVYQLGEHKFRLAVAAGDLKGASAKTGPLRDDTGVYTLSLKLPRGIDAKEQGVLIEKLLYKAAARKALPSVQARLEQINAAHFQVSTGKLKLSPTRSRWGSCSTTGTISISSRLLGAPSRCLHAVLVHELAHRIEMNHSNRFWKLVYDAMPDYDAAHGWLKTHGGSLGWVIVSNEA